MSPLAKSQKDNDLLQGSVPKKQEAARNKLIPRIWVAADLTFSYSITTPNKEIYRADGFATYDEAHASREILGMRLDLKGEGIWTPQAIGNPKPYCRRGPKPSPDSLLSHLTLTGIPWANSTPALLPDAGLTPRPPQSRKPDKRRT